jgi:hypothetical protein
LESGMRKKVINIYKDILNGMGILYNKKLHKKHTEEHLKLIERTPEFIRYKNKLISKLKEKQYES